MEEADEEEEESEKSESSEVVEQDSNSEFVRTHFKAKKNQGSFSKLIELHTMPLFYSDLTVFSVSDLK